MTTNPVAIVQQENARLQTENKRLQHELRELHEFVNALSDIARATRNAVTDAELMPLMEGIFSRALSLLNAPDGSLMLLDDQSNQLEFILVRGALSQSLKGHRIPANEGVAGWVIKNAEPTLVRDARRDPRFSDTIDEKFAFRTQSIAAAPLIGDRRVFGVIEALNQPGDQPFTEAELALLNLFCRFAGEALADIERQSAAMAESAP
jgi:GAF domain-containing protein